MTIKTYLCCTLLVMTLFSYGQDKKFIEEIALYHLDSLTKIDSHLKEFKYFTNGYVDTDTTITLFYKPNIKKEPFIFQNPFPKSELVKDRNVKIIPIIKKLKKSKSNPILNISRYTEKDGKYFISFSVATNSYSGQTILLILNLKGDLIDVNYSNWIE